MVAVTEVERALQPGSLHKLSRIVFIGEHRLAERQLIRIFFIIAGPNEIAVITFPKQLGKRATCKNGAVIEMRRNQRQDLPAMWLLRNRLLDNNVALRSSLAGQGCRCTAS
jgi:hypothetical protein